MSRVTRLGAFIVVTLAALAAGVFVIGSKEYLFRSTYQLKAQFDNVAGLSEGADVQVGGVHSGIVESIALPHKPGEKVTVLMDLNDSTHEIIKQDSVASIETEGVLGNQFVAISFGSESQAEVRNGELIGSSAPLVLADMFKKASGILDSSQEAIHNATLATAHLNSVSSKIDAGQGTIGALVNDKRIYSDLEQTTATLQATMLQAQIGVTDFQDNMEALKHNFLLSGYFKKRGYDDSGDLNANRIGSLPQAAPEKEFIYPAKQLFDGHDSAKLKDQKSLKAAGNYLAQNPFGFAVVVVSAGLQGDTQRDQVLTEARALVIRAYLVNNFGFDGTQLKTLGMGKRTGVNQEAEWGTIRILLYPVGVESPPDVVPSVPIATSVETDQPAKRSDGLVKKP